MSHFSVMVIGNDVDGQLAPFQEAGAGAPEEYLTFVDKTDEITKEYNEGLIEQVILKDGTMVYPWDDRFKVPNPSGFGSTTKVPEGLEVREVPYKEKYATIAEFASKYHGYETREDGRIGYTDNVDSKWDWYVIGGWWSGYFRLREVKNLPAPGTHTHEVAGVSFAELSVLLSFKNTDEEKFNKILRRYKGKENDIRKALDDLQSATGSFARGVRGTRGVIGLCKNDGEGFADQLIKGDIDVEYMRLAAEAEARELYGKVRAAIGENPQFTPWSAFIADVKAKKISIEEARDRYHAQDVIKAYNELGIPFTNIEEFLVTEEEYASAAYNRALTPFAFVKDGEWVESGEMGWFGMSRNDKDSDDWNAEFTKMFDALPEDTVITVVDCHV